MFKLTDLCDTHFFQNTLENTKIQGILLQDDPMLSYDPVNLLRAVNGCSDWKYTMRRTMQEVVPSVYLGPYSAAQKNNFEMLRQHQITHIVCVRQDVEAHFIRANFPNIFEYLVLNVADSVTENIIRYFPEVKRFIDECIAGGGKVLIHGNGGISRSAALAISYVMEKYNLSVKEAFTLVQQKRFCINPNEGFMAQLSEYEPIYKAQQAVMQGQSSGDCSRNKRSLDR